MVLALVRNQASLVLMLLMRVDARSTDFCLLILRRLTIPVGKLESCLGHANAVLGLDSASQFSISIHSSAGRGSGCLAAAFLNAAFTKSSVLCVIAWHSQWCV